MKKKSKLNEHTNFSLSIKIVKRERGGNDFVCTFTERTLLADIELVFCHFGLSANMYLTFEFLTRNKLHEVSKYTP